MKNKFAFTLAEVLITLVIIGVVAALTIPTAINNMEKRHLIIGWRKAYSDVSRALLLAKANNDSLEGLSSADMSAKISKYMNAKPCTDSYGYFSSYNATMSTNNCLELENGTRIRFEGWGNVAGLIVIFDVNNSRKPNRMGRDIFCGMLDRRNYKINPGKGHHDGWGCADGILMPVNKWSDCLDKSHYGYACSAYYLLNDK